MFTSETDSVFWLVGESQAVGEDELELSSPLSPGEGESLKQSASYWG